MSYNSSQKLNVLMGKTDFNNMIPKGTSDINGSQYVKITSINSSYYEVTSLIVNSRILGTVPVAVGTTAKLMNCSIAVDV